MHDDAVFEAYLARLQDQPTDSGLMRLVTKTGEERIWMYRNVRYEAIPADLSQLQYGVSVTDGCIDWATTEKMLLETRDKLKDVLPTRL